MSLSCPACGSITEGSFCSNCGAKLVEQPTQRVEYAGFWLRVVAYLIDYGISTVIWLGATFIFAVVLSPLGEDVSSGIAAAVGYLCAFGWGIFNRIILMGKTGQTVGKKIISIKVVTVSGGSIGYGLAIGRLFAEIITSLTIFLFGFGYWMAGVTQRKQALHDLICGTLVVKCEY